MGCPGVGCRVRRAVITVQSSLLAACTVIAVLMNWNLATAQDTRIDAPLPHSVGQSVSPSFEGWYPNANGSFNMVFGYFNRNYDESLDIPVGPNNRLEPGPADQGQPTHFLPRRQTGVFAIVVPSDFGEQELTWSLTAYGETIAIPGHLRPEWQIDALMEVTNKNTPPQLRFQMDGKSGQGPGGVHAKMTARSSEVTPITVWTIDDGIPRARGGRPSKPGVAWAKYRGPGSVTFSVSQTPVNEAGIATTDVTFSDPGEYILRVLASDETGGQRAVMAGGFFCCWTNGYITVDVE